jgi:hypothetical protein
MRGGIDRRDRGVFRRPPEKARKLLRGLRGLRRV